MKRKALLSILFLTAATACSHQPPLPVYQTVGDFDLTNADGTDFSSQQLQGKIWIADFIFTTCGTICPVMTKNMASLHRSYDREEDVRFLSITVNPENDTPEVLQAFAKKYDADPARWFFLTGSRETLTDLTLERFKIGAVEDMMFHSNYFVLVDRQGRVRGYYQGTEEEDVQELFRDIARLLKEKG